MISVKLIILSLILTSVASKVIELNEENWTQVLENEWMIEL